MFLYRDTANAVNLDDLAARIRAAHDGVQTAARSSIEHALTAGDLLIHAKRRLKHGEWLPWLEEHCKLSERTAQAYMRLAKHRGFVEAKSAVIADLTVAGALDLISPPRTSAGPSRGNPEGGTRRDDETRFYAPDRLNTLMWSEANSETRRRFADGVGWEFLDHCSPHVREAILNRWRTDTQRESVERMQRAQRYPLQSSGGDGLDISRLVNPSRSARPGSTKAVTPTLGEGEPA